MRRFRRSGPRSAAARIALIGAIGVSLLAGPSGVFSSAALSPTQAPSHTQTPAVTSSVSSLGLTGHYPIAYLLCDFNDWQPDPGALSDYQALWTNQSNTPAVTASVADYLRDQSFGQLDLSDSAVLGWFHMNIAPLAWKETGNREGEWQPCVNAAEAQDPTFSVLNYKSVVTITPYENVVTTSVTPAPGAFTPATTATALKDFVPVGTELPPEQVVDVDSVDGLPPAPFEMYLPTISYTSGGVNLVDKYETLEVLHVHPADANDPNNQLTIVRGFGNGAGKTAKTSQPMPLPALPKGALLTGATGDAGATVTGPYQVYVTPGGQSCSYNADASCELVTATDTPGSTPYQVGSAVLSAGDDLHDGNVTSGIGESAHEVSHTLGFEHSRTLSGSQAEYGDCFDQMSYDTCGLPPLAGAAGPPDTIVNMDAINLEHGGWLPPSKQFNSANASIAQSTIKLEELSDTDALNEPGYLDAHIPAAVKIEDADPPGNAKPPVPTPASCTGAVSLSSTPAPECEYSSYYTVEYREANGVDAPLSAHDVPSDGGAVVLHLAVTDPNNCSGDESGSGGPGCNISYLVDSQPGVGKVVNGVSTTAPTLLPHDGALYAGEDFADAPHNAYVAVNSIDPSTNSARVTVSSAPIVSRLTVNDPPVGLAGRAMRISAQLTVDDGAPVPGQSVMLTLDGGESCTGTTGMDGVAYCTIVPSIADSGSPVEGFVNGDSVYVPVSGVSPSDLQVWSPNETVPVGPSTGSDKAPAVVSLGDAWVAAWTDPSTEDIYYAIDSFQGWSPARKMVINGKAVTTSKAPALAAVSTTPVMAWTTASGSIEYSVLSINSGVWNTAFTVTGSWGTAKTGHAPAMAATVGGGLVMLWSGQSDNRLYVSHLSAGGWLPQTQIGTVTTTMGPAVVADSVNGGVEYYAWTNSDGSIGMMISVGGAQTFLSPVPGADTDASPSLAYNPSTDTLAVAWKVSGERQLDYGISQDGSLAADQGLTLHGAEPQAATDQPPAISIAGDSMIAVWDNLPITGGIDSATTQLPSVGLP